MLQMNANVFNKTHLWATFSPGHPFATPALVIWGSREEPPAGAGSTHSWLNMRFISSVMFTEPTSSSENRFTSPSCSEMSSSEVTLRSFFLGTT